MLRFSTIVLIRGSASLVGTQFPKDADVNNIILFYTLSALL